MTSNAEQLKASLIQRFGVAGGTVTQYCDLEQIRQLPNEAIEQYTYRFTTAINQIRPPMEEHLKVWIFLRGLRHRLYQLVFIKHPSNLDEAITFAKLCEHSQLQPQAQSSVSSSQHPTVNSIESSSAISSLTKLVEALIQEQRQVLQQLRGPPRRFERRTLQKRSVAPDSSKPKIVCYYCGRVGNIASQCRKSRTVKQQSGNVGINSIDSHSPQMLSIIPSQSPQFSLSSGKDMATENELKFKDEPSVVTQVPSSRQQTIA